MISYHSPRPLIICLHGIGPNTDENAPNITPLSNWGDFDADVYSIPWFKGDIGRKSWAGCLWRLGYQTKGLQIKHNPSVTIYIGFSTGFLVGCKTVQHYTARPTNLVGLPDAIISMYGVTDLTEDDFDNERNINFPGLDEKVNVPELFNIFLTGTLEASDGARRAASPAKGAIDFPVLAFHGDADTVVNERQSGYLGQYTSVAGESHGFSIFKHDDVFNSIKDFITQQEAANGSR